MLDLSQERMVPLKTIGRTRVGRECILIAACTPELSRSSYGAGYRWLWGKIPNASNAMGVGSSLPTYWTTDGGRYWNWSAALDALNDDDIVAIKRPRQLRPGDICKVNGVVGCPNTAQPIGNVVVRDWEIELAPQRPPANDAPRETWVFYREGLCYWVDRACLTFVRRPSDESR